MNSKNTSSSLFPMVIRSILLFAAFFLFAAGAVLGQEPTEYENLQVLDPDISREELGKAMLQNLRGLGLPRRQREGCLFCHVGSMDKPVADWDFPSDEKVTKKKARVMMRMVKDINENHLSKLGDRIDESFQVTCYTCHGGLTDPRPLRDVLLSAHSADGVDGAISKYRELRELYADAGAYDFRPAVLINLANEFARNGEVSDAIALAKTNESAHQGALSASRSRFALQVAEHLFGESAASGLQYFDNNRAKEKNGVVNFSVLDGLAWGLFRRERVAEALIVFEKNQQLYPDEYIANESLGDALWFSGERAAGAAVFEEWVEKNPDHEMGRRRLLNIQDELN